MTRLPDHLTIRGYLDLRGSQFTTLPDYLTVDGGIDLRATSITSLPSTLRNGGRVLGLEENQAKAREAASAIA